MNNTFNYARFGKLFRKHTVENYKGYLMSGIVLLGIITMLYTYLFIVQGSMIDYKERAVLFMFLYLFGGTIFTSTVFAEYGKKEKSIVALTLPASSFEKFLVSWLYSFLIFTGIFLLCFYVIDIFFLNASKLPKQEKEMLNLFSDEDKFYFIFYAYTLLHAIVLYGAIFFNRLHFVKTACAFFALLILLIFTNIHLIKSFIQEEHFNAVIPFTSVVFFRAGFQHMSVVSVEDSSVYYYILFMVIPIILWLASYFQLKNKQI
jgi:hypothetical protein